jgi:hypothetical protein
MSRAIWFRIPTELVECLRLRFLPPIATFWTQYPCFRHTPDESGQDSVNHATKIEIGQISVIVGDTCIVTFVRSTYSSTGFSGQGFLLANCCLISVQSLSVPPPHRILALLL